MALNEISLSGLVDLLDDTESEYADFFRPMLGYEAILKLYDGIDDSIETLLTELEDELGFEMPSDLISFYMCTNGGEFADLQLYSITNDRTIDTNLHTINALDTSLKDNLGVGKDTLLVGKYKNTDTYITCVLKDDDIYSYQLYDSNKHKVIMEFEYLIQLVALEVSYATDPDAIFDFIDSQEE